MKKKPNKIIIPVCGVMLGMSLLLTACGSNNTDPNSVASDTVSAHTDEDKHREGFSVREISDDLFDRMKGGKTYKEDCIVPREDLRYLLVLHKDKEGNIHQGEMVVHKLIAEDVLEIFEKLYDADYPIERMVLPDNYMADDETMMRDNNSSSFNFRLISHTNKISKHGLGMAVDINTLYNPYHKIVKNSDGTTEEVIEPATGKDYLDRTKKFDYKIEKDDLCYKLFTEKGFEWGGEWTDRQDYQHFELPTDITDKYSEEYTKKYSPSITGVVEEIGNGTVLIKNNDGTYAVSLNTENNLDFKKDDEIVVYFDGNIAETSPMQILKVYFISLKDEN